MQSDRSPETSYRLRPVRWSVIASVIGVFVSTPAVAQMLTGDGSITCGSPYVVASGDTLSRISAQAYGDPMLYGFIADANWDALGGNPENVGVGMSLTVPCIDASGQAVTPEQAAADAASMQGVVAAQGTLSADQLDTLFGPVALFPDQVLTPVLVAATFPLDIVKAARFVTDNQALSDQERADQSASQPWDESVQQLAAGFPSLVTRMSDNIDWTEQAGEAVVAQTDDVLASIQRLRTKAQDNGYLVDNDAQKVEKEGDTIIINPATPNVVYVPTYDTQVVYTTPVAGPPVYHYGTDPYYDDDDWDDALVTGGIILGSAVILDEIFDDDDWDGWDSDDDIDWDGGDITIDRDDINIDRDDINIDRDNINIGDGDRLNPDRGTGTALGGGDRISIGDSDRPQVDRGDLAEARERVGSGDRPTAANLPAGHKPIANPASRDAARQKIEARQTTGASPARLPATRPEAIRPSSGSTRQAVSSRPAAVHADRISRPAVSHKPAVRAPSHSTTFDRPSGHRPSAASNRGRASHGGGGRAGGGGRRR